MINTEEWTPPCMLFTVLKTKVTYKNMKRTDKSLIYYTVRYIRCVQHVKLYGKVKAKEYVRRHTTQHMNYGKGKTRIKIGRYDAEHLEYRTEKVQINR